MFHAHKLNILHCNLAARNLLVIKRGNDFTTKISDFGMSKLSQSGEYNLKEESKIPIKWSAPEILKIRKFTKASDVWSYGVVLWEILSKKLPYQDIPNKIVIEGIVKGKLSLEKPSEVFIEEFWNLIQNCWKIDLNERPTFEQIVKTLSKLVKIVLKEFPNKDIDESFYFDDNKEIVYSEPTETEVISQYANKTQFSKPIANRTSFANEYTDQPLINPDSNPINEYANATPEEKITNYQNIDIQY